MQTEDGNVYVELNCSDVHRIDRSTLFDVSPSQIESLQTEGIRTLRNWLAARYRRAALPDEFNERRRLVWDKIRKLAKVGASDIQGVYIAIQPHNRELPDTENYSVVIIGVMTETDYCDSGKKSRGLTFLGDAAATLDECNGIEIDDWELRSNRDVTMAELEYLQRLDFDDLSLREGVTPPTES